MLEQVRNFVRVLEILAADVCDAFFAWRGSAQKSKNIFHDAINTIHSGVLTK